MKNVVLIALTLVAAGCSYQPAFLGDLEPGETVTLTLHRTADGDLEHCAGEECSQYPNPDGCATLTLEINDVTGHACEKCRSEDDVVIYEGCDDTRVSCAVVRAPDPDCVVCAFIGGAVIFSSCEPVDDLECVYSSPGSPDGGASSEDPDACQTCFDELGRQLFSDCPNDCAQIACPEILCEEGFAQVRSPGECCDRCEPPGACDDVVCALDVALPACPDGSALVRDSADCCYYYCQPTACPPEPEFFVEPCPLGYTWIYELPDCGRCEPTNTGGTACTSGDQCAPNEYCTVDSGECSAPPCATDETCTAPDVCYGVCQPIDVVCPELMGPAFACEGILISGGVDADGCPLPPVCACPDGSITFDGTCVDLCADVACVQMVTDCAAGERLVTDYPNCCGICVPDDQCVSGEDPSGATGTISCPAIACGPEYHEEIGPDCCTICVRNTTSCETDVDCLPNEFCADGLERVCTSRIFCEDSDGLDPSLQGQVHGVAPGPQEYGPLFDHCDQLGNVVEYFCFDPFDGSNQTWFAETTLPCEHGCAEGACLP